MAIKRAEPMDEVYSLWRTTITIAHMLRDRKYEVDNEITLEDFQAWADTVDGDLREAMTRTYHKGETTMAILWLTSPLLGAAAIARLVETMNEMKVQRSIVVVQGKITSYALAAIRNLKVQGVHIETFTEKELQYNPTRHELVPTHTIVSAAAKKKVLEDYALTKDQMQVIKSTDVICRYLGAPKGTLLRIKRPSETFPKLALENGTVTLYDISYRIVV